MPLRLLHLYRCNKKNIYGKHTIIHPLAHLESCTLGDYCAIGENTHIKNVTMGSYSYIASETNLENCTIGKFCSIGCNIRNHLGNHPTKQFVSTSPSFYSQNPFNQISFVNKQYFPDYGQDVVIENDVWIGYGCVIMDGITIHNGAIIGAMSIVTKDVPPYAIWVGNKVIKYRFQNDEIEKLLQIAWWDKNHKWLQTNYKKFHNISNFLKEYAQGGSI